MTEREFKITDARGGAAIGVRVVTKASESEIAGRNEDGTLKVRLVASPAGDPAANRELIELIANRLGIDTSLIAVVAGADNRDKILSIEGVSSTEVDARLFPS